MRANPGGSIPPNEVVGRDRLIARIWDALELQSVVLVAERRMGKSCVVKKMMAERHPATLTLYRDVEGITTPLDFAEHVYRDVEGHLNTLGKAARKVRSWLESIGGAEIGGVLRLPQLAAPHWKLLLEQALEDLAKQQDRRVVLFWDELPLMLRRFAQSGGEPIAMEVLDRLRGLRQMHASLRMVYTGSIGLHHVTSALRGAGHASDPTNDMRTIEVPMLDTDDAVHLASELLSGEHLQSEDRDATARSLAEAVDCIPFYIHWVVRSLKDRGDEASPALVGQVVSNALVDPGDAWHMAHYRDRLSDYYLAHQVPVVLAVLDGLAIAAGPLSLERIAAALGAHLDRDSGDTAQRILGGDREALRDLLRLMQRDHYVRQLPDDGSYHFSFPLIARWWRVHRNLT